MTKFIKTINKYVILLIISSIFGMPWLYFRFLVFENLVPESIVNSIPTIVDYLIRIVVIVLLIIDFKKYNLRNVVLTCIAALFFPLLGIVIFSILMLTDERNKANA